MRFSGYPVPFVFIQGPTSIYGFYPITGTVPLLVIGFKAKVSGIGGRGTRNKRRIKARIRSYR